MTALAPTLQAFFTERLISQRQASGHTIAAYRDCYRLLLSFLHDTHGTQPSQLDFADLDATTITAFLTHLQTDRGVSTATRNARLAAIHSMFRYAALRHPEHAELIARVLAIPPKRSTRPTVTYLSTTEADALIATPDLTRPTGRRDHALLVLALQTGLRASELVGIRHRHITLSSGPNVRVIGKGRKERATPLTTTTVEVLRAWMSEQDDNAETPLFPGPSGAPLGRDALRKIVVKHARAASMTCCPSMARKHIGVHTLRHTCAMNLLQAGVDSATIALWLGHETLRTVQVYLHADMTIKEQAIARTAPPDTEAGRYQPPDRLLHFLEEL